MSRIVCRYSCGAASAVATKLTLANYDRDRVVITYSNPGSEHPDNNRFLADCVRWFNHPITTLKSGKYADTWGVWEGERFITSKNGAPCTGLLKRAPTYDFQQPGDILVFGYTVEERARADSFRKQNFEQPFETPLIDAGLTKADCLAMIERAGIELPAMYKLGYHNNNCLSGETEFLTDLGIRRLNEAVGDTVRVRGAGGGWTQAIVQSFGVQRLEKLTLQRPGREKVIFATAGHRWFIKQQGHGAKVEKATEQLKPGDKLAAIYGQLGARVRPSPFGVAQGIVFGDGTRGTTLNTAVTLVLCGDKNRELLRYFPLCPTGEKPAGIEVRDLPRFWKDAPRLDESQSFLYGWLAGYFAADGCATDDGSYILSSANLAHLQTAKDVAVRLGIGCHEIRSVERIGLGIEATTLYSLPLIGATLRPDFFLVEQHRSRFVASQPRTPHQWVVVSVEPSDREEEVFCAVVPEGQAFTLDGNILTGNCIGCPKGGMGYWNKIRVDFPDVFERMAALQRKLGPGSSFFHDGNGRIALDQLAPDRGNHDDEPNIECSLLCHIAEKDIEAA